MVRRHELAGSLFWLAIGLGTCYGGVNVKLGSLTNPGPGFLFFWTGIVIVGLSLGIFLQAIRKKEGDTGKPLWAGSRWKKVVSLLLALFLYASAFTSLGFLLSTAVLLVFLFKAVEPQGWAAAMWGSVLTTLAAYVVFHVWLGSQLPAGILGIGW